MAILRNKTATTTAARTDIIYIVRDPAGTPVDRKMTIDDYFLSQTGNRSVLAYASLAAAVTAIGTADATLEIPATTTVSASLTVPKNVFLLFIGTGQISVSSGQTLTTSRFQAGNRQIFTGLGSVVVNGQAVIPQWFGAQAAGQVVTDGAMTASGTTLTSATANFTSSMVGWLIDMEGSGTSAVDLHGVTARHNQAGTISAWISATQVTVSFVAVATVSGKQVTFGPDDATALQKTAASGTEIYFPAGHYVHGSAIPLSSGRVVYGAGQGVSIIKTIGPTRNGASGVNVFTIADGVRDVGIYDLSLRGTDVNALEVSVITAYSHGVSLGTGIGGAIENITIRDCELAYFWGMGLRNAGDSGDQLSGVPTCINWKILDCFVHHNADNGLNPHVGGGLGIRGCTITDNDAGGIEWAGSKVIIDDNHIARNKNVGIALGGLGNPSLGVDNLLTGNLIERNGRTGAAGGGAGIQVGGNIVHVIIADNIIRENAYQGIGIADGLPDFSTLSRDIRITDNQIISNGDDTVPGSGTGISVAIDGVVLESNDVFDDGATGFTQTTGITARGNGVQLLRNRTHGHSAFDYVFAESTNALLVTDQASVTIQQFEGNGYTGTVDTSSTTATYKTGDLFSTNWVGVPIKITTVPYLISAVAANPTGNFTVAGLTVTRTSGPNFETAWVGQYIKLGPSFYFPIAAVGGASTMTITNPIGVAVPASGAWELRGSVSMTLAASAGTQSNVDYVVPPHLVRLPNDGFITADFFAAPVFDAGAASTFKITLTGNVTGSILANGVDGQVVTFMIYQDGTGSRTFAWPSNVFGVTVIGSTASKVNVQSFRKSGSNWYAVAAGVINQG